MRFLLCSFSAVLGLALGASADTVVLKSGEKVEGRILSENDTQVTVEVQVTASIKDERVFKKADIDKIDKIQPDEVAWPALKGLALAKESFEAVDYQRAEAALQNFLTQFPASGHAEEAKSKLAEFSAEQKRVADGEVKLDGKWLSKDQVEEEKVQIAGRVLYSRMARLASAGQLVEAMNVFDALEKNYGGSAAMPDAITLAVQLLPNLEKAAVQGRERVKAQADVNRKRLETAQGQEREQLQTMLRNEAAAANAAAQNASKSGVKWAPLVPVEGVLNTTATRAASDLSNLKSRPVQKMRDAIAAAEDVKKALEAKDIPAAEKAMTQAQSAWSTYEALKRLQVKVAAAKKDVADAKVTADKEAAAEAAAAAAAKVKAEKEEADKKAKAAAAAAAQPVVTEEPKETSSPFYTKPIVWVVLVLLALFGTLGMKAYHKFRDPNRNLLDQ